MKVFRHLFNSDDEIFNLYTTRSLTQQETLDIENIITEAQEEEDDWDIDNALNSISEYLRKQQIHVEVELDQEYEI